MTNRTNTAEGGTNGTAVTTGNSGGASGDAWGAVSAGAGGSIVYTTTSPISGLLSYLLSPASGVTCYMLMNDGTPGMSFTISERINLAGLPSSETIWINVQTAAGGNVARLHLDTAGRLKIINAAGSFVAQFTTALSLNTDYRVTFYGDVSASANVTAKLYAGTSSTPIETLSPTGVNTGTTAAGRTVVGKFTATGTMAPFRLDNYKQNLQSNVEYTESSNAAPTANAGADQTNVEPWSTVTLDGSGSTDSDGTITGHTWTQTSGTTVSLSGSGTGNRTFQAPASMAGETLVFSLVVTDNLGATSTADTVSITILPATEARRVSGGTAWQPERMLTRSAGAWI